MNDTLNGTSTTTATTDRHQSQMTQKLIDVLISMPKKKKYL